MGFLKRDRPPTTIRHGQRFSADEFNRYMDFRCRELVASNIITRPVEAAFGASVADRSRQTWRMRYPFLPVHVVIQDDRVGVYGASQIQRPVGPRDLCHFLEREDIVQVSMPETDDDRLHALDGDEMLLGAAQGHPLLTVAVKSVPTYINPDGPWPDNESAFWLVLSSEGRTGAADEHLLGARDSLLV